MAKKRPPPLRETDLYGPVRDYLVAQGYDVQAEVGHCDMTARKGDDLIVVELKRRFSVQLLVQATERQRISDSVYVALPSPADSGRRWQRIQRLLRRLELGLMLVFLDGPAPRVEVVFHPLPYQRQKRKRARRAVLEEMAGRSGDYDFGDGVRRGVVTAYREKAIHVACCLDKLGPLAPRQLRALGTGPKTLSILSKNHYEWFQRIARGIYAITARGRAALDIYPYVVEQYRKSLDKGSGPT